MGIIGLPSSRLTLRQVEIIFLLQNLCYTEIALKSNLGVQQGSPICPAIKSASILLKLQYLLINDSYLSTVCTNGW